MRINLRIDGLLEIDCDDARVNNVGQIHDAPDVYTEGLIESESSQDHLNDIKKQGSVIKFHFIKQMRSEIFTIYWIS